MLEVAARFRSVHVDFGTGDGAFVLHHARECPDVLVIGVDANAANLRQASHRVGRKPARGGLPNAFFGRLALEDAPGALHGLARDLTVLLPWGSLLEAVALAEVTPLARLLALSRPAGRFTFVFGYDAIADPALCESAALPPLDEPQALALLERRYREAHFTVTVRRLSTEQMGRWPSTWARKLAVGGRRRPFVEVSGVVPAQITTRICD